MTVYLRADASERVGTGHVMRMLTLARQLLQRGIEVQLLGAVTVPWVQEQIDAVGGLELRHIDGDGFAFQDVSLSNTDAIVVDHYLFDSSAAWQILARCPNLVTFVDGPWQQPTPGVVVSPSLSSKLPWLEARVDTTTRLFSGPSFVLVREVVKELELGEDSRTESDRPSIVVSLGGSATLKSSGWVVEALESLDQVFEADVFVMGDQSAATEVAWGKHIRVREVGPELVEALSRASLVVSGAGTTAFELIFLGLPSVFVQTAPNQSENIEQINFLNLGASMNANDVNRSAKLAELVASTLQGVNAGRPNRLSRKKIIDGYGAVRVADIIIEMLGNESSPSL